MALWQNIYETLDSVVLKMGLSKSRTCLKKNGFLTNPFDFSVTQLIGMYQNAFNQTPNPKQKLKKRDHVAIKEIAWGLTDLLDYQASWNIIKIHYPELSEDDFNKMPQKKRHDLFINLIEEKQDQYNDLKRPRNNLIKYLKNQRAIPEDYR